MTDHFRLMEEGLRQILGSLKAQLTEDEAVQIAEFVDVGEYGVALEQLCAVLAEDETPIASVLLARLKELGEAMGIHPDTYRGIVIRD